jgi:AraC-like DNA-binding protein/DNA gyrase inhibitor GyrI
MARKGKAVQKQFHASQIGRARRFIRVHMNRALTLGQIAREAGASPFHFVRIFLAYTGETPFDFLRRVRLITAVGMLQDDPAGSITEIALSVGYETPSAFNKVFKKKLGLSPGEFRNLGKEKQYDLIYSLSRPSKTEEINMKVNLTTNYEVVSRPAFHYIFLQKSGPFAEIAPATWDEFARLQSDQIRPDEIRGMLGLSTIDKDKNGEEAMIYQAGLAVAAKPAPIPKGLQYKKIDAGKYARFLLTGAYSQISPAFSQVFRALSEKSVALREDYCVENYLNDPRNTQEEQLLTEILVPVA